MLVRWVSASALLLPSLVIASDDLQVIDETKDSPLRSAIVPLVFSSGTMGTAYGGAASFQGLGQPQAQVVSVLVGSSNDSYAAFNGAYNYQLSADSNWFFDLEWFEAKFMESDVYADNGKHNSDDDGYVTGEEQITDLRATAKYVFPWGDKTKQPTYEIVAGLPDYPKGEEIPYPEATTSIQFTPFFKRIQLADSSPELEDNETKGVRLRFEHDARDFRPSPSKGHHLKVDVHRDWGGSDRDSYTKWEAQYSHYFNFGSSELMKQRSLALTGYFSDVPTWNENTHQAPWFAASTLGGWKRMRGYSGNRFHDRSAVFYGAEYRFVPNYQPQGGIPFLNWYQFPWYQVALFSEVGRVNEDFDLSELHEDLNVSYGFGLRLWVERVLVRMDWAYSDAGSEMRVVVNQPF